MLWHSAVVLLQYKPKTNYMNTEQKIRIKHYPPVEAASIDEARLNYEPLTYHLIEEYLDRYAWYVGNNIADKIIALYQCRKFEWFDLEIQSEQEVSPEDIINTVKELVDIKDYKTVVISIIHKRCEVWEERNEMWSEMVKRAFSLMFTGREESWRSKLKVTFFSNICFDPAIPRPTIRIALSEEYAEKRVFNYQ